MSRAHDERFRRTDARSRLARESRHARREPRGQLFGAKPRSLVAQNLAPLRQKERRPTPDARRTLRYVPAARRRRILARRFFTSVFCLLPFAFYLPRSVPDLDAH